MGRPLRIEFEGAIYHIMARANGRLWFYKNKNDFNNLVEVLAEVKQKYNFKYHAVVLMRNHYHILLETPLANLSLGMTKLNSRFAIFFNRMHNNKGRVFRHRYKSIVVQSKIYFKNVYRYINQNPLRINLVERVEDYPGNLFFNLSKRDHNKLLSNEIIKTYFQNEKEKLKWLNDKLEENPFKQVKQKYFLGKSDWITKIKSKYLDSNLSRDIISHKKLLTSSEKLGLIFKEIRKYKGNKNYKNFQLYFLSQYSQLTMKEIAYKLNYKSAYSVSQTLYAFRKKLELNNDLKKVVDNIIKKLDN